MRTNTEMLDYLRNKVNEVQAQLANERLKAKATARAYQDTIRRQRSEIDALGQRLAVVELQIAQQPAVDA